MKSWFGQRSRRSHAHKQTRRSLFGKLESLEPRAMMAGLVQEGDLGYLGAFNVPEGQIGESSFEYGGTGLAFNPKNHSLFVVGHDYEQSIAEIAIPQLRTGSLGELDTAGVVQPFESVLDRIPHQSLDTDNPVKLGGLLVDGDRLVGTAYEYYDGDEDAVDSHFTLSSLNLNSADIGGLYQVGDMGGGFVGGYMTPVPAQWQDELGAPYLTGQAGLSIIDRTSAGPAAFGFDPDQLGDTAAPATALVNYPLTHPLAPETTQNPLYNTSTEIKGVVFPEGTDSVLFIGSHGTGKWWYGEADEGNLHDPYRLEKGPHAPEYVYQIWAYDVHDLIAVKNGEKQPWEVQPYDVWNFDLPFADGAHHIGGVAYDSATGRLYISQQYGNEAYPVIHAFQVGEPTGDPPPDPTNHAPTAVTLQGALASLPEMTPISTNLKVADIKVSDDGLGTNTLTLAGADQSKFSIVGNALYLNAGVQLDYEAQSSLTVTVLANDSSLGGSVSADYPLQITNVNDAPVLDSALSPTLNTIYEDSVNLYGTPVYVLTNIAVADQDAGALKGIAVTAAAESNGTWQYTLNGGMTWLPMGQPTPGAARLLSADMMTQVRFLPGANFSGVVKLWYQAWDRTAGIVGGTLAVAGNSGGDKSLSTAYENASLTIQPVNDAPVLALSGSVGYKLNASPIVLAPNATVSDVDSENFAGGVLRVSIGSGTDASNRIEIGGAFTVKGGKLFYSGVQIGTITSNGIGTNALAITLTYRATPLVVQELVRSLTFRTYRGTNPISRMVYFQLTDGDGGSSQVMTKTVAIGSTGTWYPI